jgi:hypothetical protein
LATRLKAPLSPGQSTSENVFKHERTCVWLVQQYGSIEPQPLEFTAGALHVFIAARNMALHVPLGARD